MIVLIAEKLWTGRPLCAVPVRWCLCERGVPISCISCKPHDGCGLDGNYLLEFMRQKVVKKKKRPPGTEINTGMGVGVGWGRGWCKSKIQRNNERKDAKKEEKERMDDE